MKISKIALISALGAFSIYAQNLPFSYPLNPDSSSVKMILKYNLGYSNQQEIELMQKMINNKAYAEFHLGAAITVDQNAKYDKVAILGIKVSPLNPKLPFANNIIAKAFKIRQLAKIMGDSLSDQNMAFLNRVDKELSTYNKHKWERFSVMLSFPFHLNTYDTVYYYSPVDSLYHNRIQTIYEPKFLQQVALSLGYDIGDIGTISLGGTFYEKPSFIISLSIDVSTPTYTALASFIMHIKSVAYNRLPTYQYYGND